MFSFLTILPSPSATLESTARYMWLFPVAGIVIGLLVGSVGLGLSEFMDPLLVGLLVVAFLAIITGIHHADGLADFADGLMAKGAREEKLGAMKDVSIGSAGIVGIVLYLVGLIIVISMTEGLELLRAILVSEILAKFSMVLVAGIGSSASVGSGSAFVSLMKDRRKLASASVITIVPVVLVGGEAGMMMLGATIAVTLIILAISTRSFGGITGDVMGATNELARLASLMVFVIL